MQKITLLCLANDQAGTLEALRDLGVVHLQPQAAQAGATPGDSAATQAELLRLEAALQQLSRMAPEQQETSVAPRTPDSSAPGPDATNGAALARRAEADTAARTALEERLEELQAEATAQADLGHFDPAQVAALLTRGVHVSLHRAPGPTRPAIANACVVALQAGHNSLLYVLVACEPGLSKDPVVPWPVRSLATIEREIGDTTAALAANQVLLQQLAEQRPALQTWVDTLRDRLNYQRAAEGMGRHQSIQSLQGFCPMPGVPALRAAASRHGWGLVVSEPAVTDPVPTLIHNPAWVRPIQALFDFIKISPGYREVDVSASFLIALSLFFAMIVGDAGYGLLYLLLTLWAWHRMKPQGIHRYPFMLFVLFGVCTMAWGALTGTYFGIQFEHLHPALQRLRYDWLTSERNVMALCLTIGSIHLTLAHLWNMLRVINSPRALAQLGWIGVVWTMYFGARALFGMAPFPPAFIPFSIASFILIPVFMTPPSRLKADWIMHAMLPLSIISSFGDVLSYLRLFALGMASLQIARSFNDMAMSVGMDSLLAQLGVALILLAGHTLNIVLSIMSVLVHGVRLNALEFSMHLGLEWSGVQYTPFRRVGTPLQV